MPAKILVVDDEVVLERLILQKFRKQIELQKYEFIFARHGQDALDKLQTHPEIDVILTDLRMPVMNGLELLTQLQQRQLDRKTAIVSAYPQMQNIRKSMNQGAFDFIVKPIDFGDLERTIEKILESLSSSPAPAKVTSPLTPVNPLDTLDRLVRSERKPQLRTLLKLLDKLTSEEKYEAIANLIEKLKTEDLESLKEDLELQYQLALQSEREGERFPDEERVSTENGFLERRNIHKKLADGTVKTYVYYYWRWQEDGRWRSRCLGSADPRMKINVPQDDESPSNFNHQELEGERENSGIKKPPIRLDKSSRSNG